MMRMVTRWLMLGMLLGPGWLWGQQAFDARAAGMAFSNGADTRALQSVGLNPATLALETPYNFEFNLISANVTANNNSFKKSQYDRYFTTGAVLSGQDIDDILSSIPGSGLRADGFARVNTIAFYIPYFSFSIVGMGVGKLNVPKEVLDLPLRGNVATPGRSYRFDNSEGGDWAGIGLVASGAYPFPLPRNSQWDLLAAGMTVKYLSGIHYDNIERASGELQDFDLARNRPFIDLKGEVEVLSSEGGQGFGIDVGFLGRWEKKFTVGVTLLNALSTVRWSVEAERQIFSLRGDSLNLPDRVKDSLIVDTDTTIALSGFSSSLPLILDLAMAYQATPQLLVSAEYEQGLNNSMGGTKRARVAFGLEYRGIPALPLRTGFTFGAKTGSSFALGFGLDFKYWYIDLAYINHGRIFPDDFKGMGLGVSTRLRF